jgi:uncharacterized protein
MMQYFWIMLGLLTAIPALAADPPKPGAKANRLAGEVSPYLLQHAYNPVDWHPWGPEAFALAKKENKLVFLSIGYSACHWCHVMERESFSNTAIAEIMNKNFICIKVDREERPDVDEIYMTALQALNESGGWPLSMFLTNSAKPIFGGTYWPPEDKMVDGEKVIGFKSVLTRVMELDTKDRAGLEKQADYVAKLTTTALEKNIKTLPLTELKPDLVLGVSEAFEIDPVHGGLGSKLRQFVGTKFPKSPAMLYLVRQLAKPNQQSLTKGVQLTLRKMADGGIYDQIGGGFHRYSTERTWTVPHFEKMLYDNAQLMEVYSVYRGITGNQEFDGTIRQTADFLAREMTSPEGGFYSALDADSEGHEGRFYVWTAKQLTEVLGAENLATRSHFGFTEKPNFEGEYYIPCVKKPLDAKFAAEVEAAKAKLFAARAKRERPFLDKKILTAWNGQMIAGYAEAGRVLKEPKYIEAAAKAAEFLLKNMRTKEGRLLRIYAAKPNEKPSARGTAFLDDYAYLIHGLLNLYDATQAPQWLHASQQLADVMLKHYYDADKGGFYLTANDGEQLFARGQDHYDGAQPSANAMAMRCCVRLAIITKDAKFVLAAEKTLKRFAPILQEHPTSAPMTADALELWLASREVPKSP